eukprot:g10650.t1
MLVAILKTIRCTILSAFFDKIILRIRIGRIRMGLPIGASAFTDTSSTTQQRSRKGGKKASRTMYQQKQRDAKLADEADFYFNCVATTLKKRYNQKVQKVKTIKINDPISNHEKAIFGTISGTEGINFDKYDDIPVKRSGGGSNEYPVLESFVNDKLLHSHMPPYLARNIKLCGYVKPTPVQKHSIPAAIGFNDRNEASDLMVCAQTGSGKTAAFLLPLFTRKLAVRPIADKFGKENKSALPIALVMAPTRELAIQIHGESMKFSNGSTFQTVCVYGGSPLRVQLKELANGCDLLVATPGRLIDIMERGIISMAQCSYLCLDEADRMLDMGFEPQIRRVVQHSDMPQPTDGRQTLMFSATFPNEMQKLAADFMSNYMWIGVGRVGSSTENITQKVILTKARDKTDPLLDALNDIDGMAIVFVAKKKTAGWLFHFLRDNNVSATAIHGDRTQAERERALNDFKMGKARVLVATDVAARGLDVAGVKHVINYDLPGNIEDYTHRIGRTGRAGNLGTATSFFVMDQGRASNMNIAKQLYKFLKQHNQEMPQFLASVNSGGNKGGDKKRKGFDDYRNNNNNNNYNGGGGRSKKRGGRGSSSRSNNNGGGRGGRRNNNTSFFNGGSSSYFLKYI